jgi:hypothetical protein
MRFHVGPIPDDFAPDDAWRPIREPGPFMVQLFAAPVGIGAALLANYAWHRVAPPASFDFAESHLTLVSWAIVLSFPALILFHELAHAFVHPGFGGSPATIIGIWPSRLVFYAHYCGPLTRDRFLTVFAMPVLVITVLPLAVAATGVLPPVVTIAARWFSTWNAFFACGDYIGFALIWAQVPRAAIVQNRGWHTYWKPA